MKYNLVVIVFFAFFSTGCASTNPASQYINMNQQRVDQYIEIHGSHLEKLNGQISKECYTKIIDKKRNLSLETLIKLAYQGSVFYHLDENGTIVNVNFDTKNSTIIKRMCLKNIAIGYQLLDTDGLEYISSEFTVTYTQ